MQFVLRQQDDTSNPTLARAYGVQSTRGRVVLHDMDGARKIFILMLCQGGKYGCDGIDEYHYNGTDLPSSDVDGLIWKFHPGTRSLGYDDPDQGRPEFFPTLDETYSGKCYLEVRLPASIALSADEVPDGSEVFMRGLKVMGYDLVDDLLEETAPAVSSNNALVGLDILREVGKLPLSRFQKWASWWNFYKTTCDETIEWDKGVDHGGVVEIPRYQANVVFPNSMGYAAAFQTAIDRSPGVTWQDINGGIRVQTPFLVDIDPIHTFDASDILRKGLALTPPDPDTLFNYFLFLFRDIDDVDPTTGQLLYRTRKVEIDLPALRDANDGILNQFGPFDLGGGPMHQSLAERMGWYIVRNITAINAERDMIDEPIYPLQFEVKAQMDSFHVAKSDNYVRIANHHMVGLATPRCKVIKETGHPKKGERTFVVRLTTADAYRDADHSEYAGM